MGLEVNTNTFFLIYVKLSDYQIIIAQRVEQISGRQTQPVTYLPDSSKLRHDEDRLIYNK